MCGIIVGKSHSNKGIVPSRIKKLTSASKKECYSMKLELLTNATVVDDPLDLYQKKLTI